MCLPELAQSSQQTGFTLYVFQLLSQQSTKRGGVGMNMPQMLKYLCQYLRLSRNQFTDERAQCQNLFDIVLVV